jgi:hypothetical protein
MGGGMAEQAKGTFRVAAWEENTYEELGSGGKLTKADVTFEFGGDLIGQGRWQAVMCYLADGTASFAGFQHMIGTLGGREGSFVVRAEGTFENGEARSTWEVLEGTASGGLRGLRGTGTAVTTGASGGEFALGYELG